MSRARRIRVLIYEGPEDWVNLCTENKDRYVKGRRVVEKWTPKNQPFDVQPLMEIPVPYKTITEYLTELEII
jgi:hypothetical protein